MSLQSRHTYKCCNLGNGVLTLEFLLDSGKYKVGTDCYPKMSLDSILGIAPQHLYDDVLFYPFEEDLNVPSIR